MSKATAFIGNSDAHSTTQRQGRPVHFDIRKGVGILEETVPIAFGPLPMVVGPENGEEGS